MTVRTPEVLGAMQDIVSSGGCTFEPPRIEHETVHAILIESKSYYDVALFRTEELRDNYMDQVRREKGVVFRPVSIDLEVGTYKRIVIERDGTVHKDCGSECGYVLHAKPVRKIGNK